MTRFALFAALAVSLAAAVPAAADQPDVVGARVTQDPDAVRAYWTPERMRTATPADVVRGNGPQRPDKRPGTPGGGGGGTTSGTAVAVTNWNSPDALTRSNGKVFFTEGSTNYVCSGTAINSPSGSVVWTAGHCVNGGGNNTFVTNWAFSPAYKSPFGYPQFLAQRLYTSTAWSANRDFDFDFGAAVVRKNGDNTLAQTLGNNTRTMAFNTTGAQGTSIYAYGYPAAQPYNGQTLYHCDSQIKYNDGSPQTAPIGIPCTMTGGSSGGAWLDAPSGNQVSNTSYGYSNLKNVLFGPQLQGTAKAMLEAADTNGNPAGVVHSP